VPINCRYQESKAITTLLKNPYRSIQAHDVSFEQRASFQTEASSVDRENQWTKTNRQLAEAQARNNNTGGIVFL